MGLLSIKYVRAEKIDKATRAKWGLPDTGMVKVRMTNPNFEKSYVPVNSVSRDMNTAFAGKNLSALKTDISTVVI